MSMVVLAGGLLSAVMALAWRVQRATGNSGWIDVFWSFGLGAVAVALALWPLGQNVWPDVRQLCVAALAGSWSLRLGLHLLLRTKAMDDDPRYRKLMDDWGERASSNLFWQLQIQALVALLLVVAIALAAHNPAEYIRAQDVAAGLILVIGIAGEALSDFQLRRFKADPANRGKICDTGLWRWSRHPNYFFDWLIWISYPLLAIDFSGAYPFGFLALSAPICMYWILVHVSGIPPLEAHMLRTREAAFRNYQKRTNAFFPSPPR
jgi:steroid 5-alpha reductase family enzyme